MNDQEAEAEALAAAAKEDGEESSDSSDSDSNSSSGSSSDFGLKNEHGKEKKPKAKAKPKTKSGSTGQRKPKHTDEAAEVPGEAQEEPAPSVLSSDKGSQPAPEDGKKSSPAAMYEKAKVCLSSLKEMSAWSISNGLKAPYVEGRVAKAFDFISKLEGQQDPNSLSLAKELGAEADRVSHAMEMFPSLTSVDPLVEVLQTHGADIAGTVIQWTFEQFNSYLTDLGRKLCDLLSSQIGDISKVPVFFHFVSIASSDKWKGLSLGLFKEKADRISDEKLRQETLIHLAQVKHNLLNYFLDRFRTMNANIVEAVLAAMPLEWRVPEICRTGSQTNVLD